MFSYFFTLCLLCCSLPSLVAGRSTNVTVDDSGVDPYSGQMLVYTSGWHTCHHCPDAIQSAVNGTEHTVSVRSSNQQEQTASFVFNGESELNIILDGSDNPEN